jgi:uncharacterized membrane protein YGL010W
MENEDNDIRKIDRLLTEYGESHQHVTNKAIHWICVPLIFFSIVGLTASIPSGAVQSLLGQGNPYANWATLFLILAIAYYASLSVTLAMGMALFALGCLVLAKMITQTGQSLWMISLIIFVVAWMGQFYGHRVEGKKPSFFKDLQFLLIGPAWLLHFVYEKIGIPY